jgi:hypothetical protein
MAILYERAHVSTRTVSLRLSRLKNYLLTVAPCASRNVVRIPMLPAVFLSAACMFP